MLYKYESDIFYNEKIGTEHDIHMELIITLSDFLEGKNITLALLSNIEDIRKTLFITLVEQIIPKIITDTKISTANPPDRTKTKVKINTHGSGLCGEEQKADSISALFRNELAMIIHIESDQPINPMQAMNFEIANIASSITSNTIHILSNSYLGTSQATDKFNCKTSDGKVTEYKVDSTSDSGRNN